jgi:CRP-like cAMP-binding protein
MTATDAYRRLWREVHDVLEVGGDAHPMGRVVNGFIITLIFLNAITFAADTVPEFAERYGWEFKAFNGGEAVVEISPSRQVVLKEGDFFGEMALLEHRRHKHDVVANARCRLYVLDSGSLARLGRRHPELMESIRKMAEARAVDDEPAQREDRKRKVGAKG